jgi:hypothetical protein
MRATTARLGQGRPASRQAAAQPPGFLATTIRIVWVLGLTGSALVGAILWQARAQCPEPCRIDGMTAAQALKGTVARSAPR